MNKEKEQHVGLTLSWAFLLLLLLLLFFLCLVPHPGAAIRTSPSTTTTTTTLSLQAHKRTHITTTTNNTITRNRRAATKRQICPPLEEDVSQGGAYGRPRREEFSLPAHVMKDCVMNRRGYVVEAGAAGECRASILNLYDCDPRQAMMVLVTLDETANSNGSLQIYQVTESGGVNVYLKEEQPGGYTLFCIDNHTSEALAKVYVGFKVLDVEEFSCRIESEEEELDCAWTRPYNPAQIDNDYRPYLCVDQEHVACGCPGSTCSTAGDTCTKECCRWDVNALPNMTAAHVSMVFWVKNPLMGDYTYFRHSFDPLAVVVPEAPQEVEVVVAGLGFEVMWRTPAALVAFPPCLAFLLEHRDAAACPACAWTRDARGTCCAPECRGEGRLEHWWRRYEVRVRLRSALAEEDGWWSEWQTRYVNTSAAAPDAPPAVGPGTFQVEAAGFAGLSDLTLTWQAVPPLLHNGSDFVYLAQLCGGGGGGGSGGLRAAVLQEACRTEVLQEAAVTESFAVFHNVSSAAPYTLRVSSSNSAGGGPWAAVWVAAAAARPAPPLLPVVVQHGGAGRQDALYELRWAPGGEATHTVYLCTGQHGRAGRGGRPCSGQLYWASAGNASAANLTLQDFGLQDAAPPQVSFAVSAEDAAGASSGLSWDRCGAPQPYSSVRSPPELGEPVTSASGVELPWTLSCAFRAGVVEEVEATCCRGAHASPQNCTEKPAAATGQPWTGSVSLAGLEADEEYTAWLRLHYRGGASDWADGKTFTTDPAGMEAWLVVLVACAGVLAAVTLVFALVYGRRKFVDNLKKLRIKPSLPSGLVPAGRQQEPNGSLGGGERDDGKGGGGGRGGGGGGVVPVSQTTLPESVNNTTYSKIIPTVFGTRPSFPLNDRDVGQDVSFGRGVTQGGKLTIQEQGQPKQGSRTAEDLQATSTRPPGSTTVAFSGSLECLASPSTSDPLLRKTYTANYISAYFSESEGESRDTYTTKPPFNGSYVDLAEPGSNEERRNDRRGEVAVVGDSTSPLGTPSSSSGGGSAYVDPSACTKLSEMSVSSGYVSAQHGDLVAKENPGYVQADAMPHPPIATENVTSGGYVSADFPMTVPAPADSTFNPVTTSNDLSASRHDLEDSIPSSSLRGDPRASGEQEEAGKQSYVTLPDMEWLSGKQTAPTTHKLDIKGSESREMHPHPPSNAPAPGYIAVQPPDFGTHLQGEKTEGKTGGESKEGYHDLGSLSTLLSKPSHALHASPASLTTPVFPVMALDTPGVPCEAPKPGISNWEGSVGADGYVPLPATVPDEANERKNSTASANSWLNSLISPPRASVTAETPLTGISFFMIDNNPSRSSSVSAGTEIKETDVDAGDAAGEGRAAEWEAQNEWVENDILPVDELPMGYSRVGDPSDDM